SSSPSGPPVTPTASLLPTGRTNPTRSAADDVSPIAGWEAGPRCRSVRFGPQLAGYGHLAAARAEFLARLGRTHDARTAYEEALLLTENTIERDYLTH